MLILKSQMIFRLTSIRAHLICLGILLKLETLFIWSIGMWCINCPSLPRRGSSRLRIWKTVSSKIQIKNFWIWRLFHQPSFGFWLIRPYIRLTWSMIKFRISTVLSNLKRMKSSLTVFTTLSYRLSTCYRSQVWLSNAPASRLSFSWREKSAVRSIK